MVFTQNEFCSRLSSRKVRFKTKTVTFGVGPSATYAVHLRLTGKLFVDFLLFIIELFRHVLQPMRYKRIQIGNRRF